MSRSFRSGTIVAAILAALCARGSGELQAVKDPDAVALPSGAKLLVECDDRAFSRDMEKEFLQVLDRHTALAAVPASSLFLPTRTYSADDRDLILNEAGIRFVLRVTVRSEDRLRKTVLVATSRTTAVAVPRNAGIAADFDVELESRSGGPKLWVATARYRGSNHNDVADQVADDATDDLVDQGILPKKK